MTEITVNLAVSGLATAQQLRVQLAAKQQDAQTARALMLDRHAAEVAASDQELALFAARLAEFDAFIAYQQANG